MSQSTRNAEAVNRAKSILTHPSVVSQLAIDTNANVRVVAGFVQPPELTQLDVEKLMVSFDAAMPSGR